MANTSQNYTGQRELSHSRPISLGQISPQRWGVCTTTSTIGFSFSPNTGRPSHLSGHSASKTAVPSSGAALVSVG